MIVALQLCPDPDWFCGQVNAYLSRELISCLHSLHLSRKDLPRTTTVHAHQTHLLAQLDVALWEQHESKAVLPAISAHGSLMGVQETAQSFAMVSS